MTEKTLTTENIKPALDALRGELAPWPVVAKKQDRLNDTQKSAVNSGITSSLVAQIIANTAAIRALESAITGTGLRALVVSSLPAVGTQGILYIVPVTTYDPETDADVVNYSNEYLWIVAPDAPVTEGYYEQVGQTGIVINNGQLNITVNNVSVGTFTANQSGDTTAAITVPTNADYVDKTTAQSIAGVKTFSDGIVGNVTGNVTGNLTGTASKAIADEDGTSIKTGYVNVAGNQEVTGQKTWSALNAHTKGLWLDGAREAYIFPENAAAYSGLLFATQAFGQSFKFGDWQTSNNEVSFNYSNAYLFIDAGYYSGTSKNRVEVSPRNADESSLGSSSYQWSSVYSQTYFYNGTQWGLDKANTWTGINTYQNDIYYSAIEPRYVFKNLGLEKGVQPSWHGTATGYWYDKNSDELGFTRFVLYNNGTQTYEIGLQNKATNGDLSPTGSTISTSFKLELFKTGDSQLTVGANALVPQVNNSCNLGASTNKWKTLNGVNPGALSLPSSNYIDISGDITIRDGSATNSLTAPCDGWIAIGTFASWLQISNDTLVMAVTGAIGADGFSQAFLPVRTGDSIRIMVNQTNTLFQSFRVFPCQGNV